MKRLLRWGCFFVFPAVLAVLCACAQSGPPEDPYKDLESKTFYACDYTRPIRGTGRYQPYQLEAVKLAERPGSVVVYGERSTGVSSRVSLATAERIADEFEYILDLISGIFGEPLYRDEDRIIALLLMDIKDGAGLNDGYMAGYFDPNDMGDSSSSNKMYMLYLDVVQGNPNREDFFATVAHELQHLIRRSVFLKTEGCAYPETWLNEGLSLAAEYVYSTAKGQIAALDKYYVDSFNGEGRASAISEGNNFFVWLDDKYVLDEYATAYFFFQWLRIQADNDTDIYKDIIASITAGKGDYQAVLDAAAVHIGDPPIDSWEVLIRSWLLANYVQAPDKNEANGLYGYNGLYRGNNEGVPKISIPASSKDQIRLYAGEGAYSNLSETGFTPPGGSGSHIKYVGVTGEGALSGTGPYTGTRLLTFNSNSSTIGTRERGYLTGSGDPPKSGRFSRQSSEARFPYRVDTVPPLPSPGRDTGPVSE